MKAANEAKVGIVVVLALLLTGSGYLFLRGVGLGAEVYRLRLNSAVNIAAGNDVRLQGVKIGQVQDVTLDPETQKPLLTLAVKPNKPQFQLLKNYQYSVRTSSLIGENYVDIRGPYNSSAAAYIPGDNSEVIPGTAVAAIADMTQIAATLGKDFRATLQKFNVTLERVNKGVLSYNNQVKLTQTLDGVSKLTKLAGQGFGPQGIKIGLGDPRAQAALNETFLNAAVASREAKFAARNMNVLTQGFGSLAGDARGVVGGMNGVVGDLRGTLSENRGQLRALLGNMTTAANNVSGLTQSLNFIVRDGGLKENSQIAFRSLRRTTENIEAASAGFKSLATDQATQQNLKETAAALRVTTESFRDTATILKSAISDPTNQQQLKTTLGVLTDTASSLKTTMANLADASGGLKNLVGDTQLQANLKSSADNLAGTLSATRAAAERVNALLGGKKPKTTDATTGDAGAKSTPEIGRTFPSGVDFTVRHFGNFGGRPRVGSDVTGRNYGDLTFNAEFFGSPFRLGLANIGDGTDLTAQSGKFIGRDAAIRYGLYRSKLGIGAEIHKGRFSLEGNLWDPNRRSANAYVGFKVTPKVEALLGREDIRGVHTTSIGVRLRP